MRLTREAMIKIARETAAQRARISRRVICAYLTGSVLGDAPLLGGTGDIDLIIIHDSEPLQPREVVRYSDEVHLDIGHYDQGIFRQPRSLRTSPWLGPFIYEKPIVLFDTQHWFDFMQASTGARFMEPDNVLKRANKLLQEARSLWMNLQVSPPAHPALAVYRYFEALENAGNALASLTGRPLTERRFFLELPQRLHDLNQAELIARLVQLMTVDPPNLDENWPSWCQSWTETYRAASRQEEAPARIHPIRQPYYERAIAALWDENPNAALWLLMRTWSLSAGQLAQDAPEYVTWESAAETLQISPSHFSARLQALDDYLDQIEETLEKWARSNGISGIGEI